MKKYFFMLLSMFIIIYISFFGSPFQKPIEETPTTKTKIINPGDRIGEFLITTAESEQIFYISREHCPFDIKTKTEVCIQAAGKKVNVGLGIYGDNSPGGKTIDDYWSNQTYKMSIEGIPVNLTAFGTVDFSSRREGAMRVWNVVVVAEEPGTVTAHSSGVVGGEPFEYTAVVTFTDP